MAFPADFTDQQQLRTSEVDRELQAAAATFYDSLQRLKMARVKHIARGLSSLWPATDQEYVHKDRDASTKGEQNDLSNAILHALATLLNEGSSALTAAQAAAVWNRYAK